MALALEVEREQSLLADGVDDYVCSGIAGLSELVGGSRRRS